ncbi:hypothetical protein LTR20_006851 [Exophiala xenobiotica]|nr:hypothetical protein LTS13_003563 [Exophiala xenobiotica]KAK5392800.1 hypothetical protein LTR79_009703 [Exophiala xenobiotica]KAK5411855.1 hypothetical protein LTR90_007416 [Exophiala xenobiotica]KAK5460426.1 hypothetical protein LTR20_006851 [Exophiala xenobiotica]KAK5481110.1 hypothetical protein LTR26_006945 [Exophiala xenobiotica]
MKVSTKALGVLATAGSAAASWTDWWDPDTTVTATLTRTTAYCPCNGEVRITPVGPESTNVDVYTTITNAVGPIFTSTTTTVPGKTITKAGPVVVVFETGGSMTTKTGMAIELIVPPTDDAGSTTYVTKTVWTGAQPTNDLAWVDWSDDDAVDGATLTRTHTAVTTVYEPESAFPTQTDDASWSDWAATTNTHTAYTNLTVTVSPTQGSTSSSGVGPISASTSTTSWYHSSWTTSSSSSTSSSGVGPIGASTSTSSSTSASTSSSSSGVGPISATTATSSTSSSTSNTSAAASSSSSSSSSSASASTTTTVAITTTTTTAATTTTTPVAVTTSTTTVATTTTTANGGLPTVTDDVRNDDYQTAILEAHNVHRANHSAADLTWNAQMATYAAETAAKCVYGHDLTPGGGGYGQNIGAGYQSTQVAAMIGNDMYNHEMPYYPTPYGLDNPDTSNFGAWGHFSQIVWKGTIGVGCATSYCATLQGATFTNYFTVCNYYPPGNVGGAYSNVGAPLGQDVVVMLTN